MFTYETLKDATFNSQEATCIEDLLNHIAAFSGEKVFTVTVRTMDGSEIYRSDIYTENEDWFTKRVVELLEDKKKSDIETALKKLTSVTTWK